MENGWWFNAPLPLLLPTLQKQGHRIVPTVWPTFHDRRNLPAQTSACLPAQRSVSRTGRNVPSSSHSGRKAAAQLYRRLHPLSSSALSDKTTHHRHVHTYRTLQTQKISSQHEHTVSLRFKRVPAHRCLASGWVVGLKLKYNHSMQGSSHDWQL